MQFAKLAIVAAALMAATVPVQAQEPSHAGYEETGSDQDWVGIRMSGAAAARCAAYARPVSQAIYQDGEPAEALRGEAAAFINWNAEGVSESAGEVSVMIGAPVKEGLDSEHVLSVGDKVTIPLVGVGDRVYVQPDHDALALEALRSGAKMQVRARLADGKVAQDSYSLMGVKATTEISKEKCL